MNLYFLLLVVLVKCVVSSIMSADIGDVVPPTNYENSVRLHGFSGVTLRWNATEEDLWISLEAKGHNGYVAFGINDHAAMAGTDTVIGWVDGQGKGHVQAYNLTKVTHMTAVPIPDVYSISNAKVYYFEGSTTITFERKKLTGQHFITDVGLVLAAIGEIPNPDIVEHVEFSRPCCPTINFDTGAVDEPFDYKLLHGIIMLIAWAIILPISVISARYVKVFRRSPLWFKIHRVLSPVGFTLAMVAGGIIFYYLQAKGKHHFSKGKFGHGSAGLVVLALSVIQIIFALIRPDIANAKKNSTIRICWEFKHLWLGRLLLLSSWIVILFGMCKYSGYGLHIARFISSPHTLPYVLSYFIWIGMLLIVIAILECRKYHHDHKMYHSVQ